MSNNDGLSAVFSNLAKASEKQELAKESALFEKLAELHGTYERTAADLGLLRDQLVEDIESGYPRLVEAGAKIRDRGVLRALKWGEKVTKTQKALLDRFTAKGEDLLVDKNLYVCEACGFISLGTEPPEICPVCKAPSSRFSIVR